MLVGFAASRNNSSSCCAQSKLIPWFINDNIATPRTPKKRKQKMQIMAWLACFNHTYGACLVVRVGGPVLYLGAGSECGQLMSMRCFLVCSHKLCSVCRFYLCPSGWVCHCVSCVPPYNVIARLTVIVWLRGCCAEYKFAQRLNLQRKNGPTRAWTADLMVISHTL